MRRILCATDLSEAADEAIRQADAWARHEGGELSVVHVVADALGGHPILPLLRSQPYTDLPELTRRAAETVARRVTEATGRPAAEFKVHVETGSPHARVLDLAETSQADLIVVGHQGSSGLKRLLLGRVAETIVRHAHCPVLVARPGQGGGGILAATDFSDPALPAVAAAARLAQQRKQPLTLLHSLDLPPALPVPEAAGLGVPPLAPLSEDDKQKLRSSIDARLHEALDRFGVQGDTKLEEGAADTAIVRAAEELRTELLVVGTVGRTGVRRMLLGSVAESVIRHAGCSVLVVRLHPAWQP